MMSQYLQVVWMYVIGILIIFIGLYLMMHNSGPSSFMVMLVGLGISAMGAAHGRRMRVMGQYDIEELMRQRGLAPKEGEAGQQQGADGSPGEMEAGAREPQEEAGGTEEETGDKEGSEAPKSGVRGLLKRTGIEVGRRKPEDILSEMEMEDIKSGKLMPTEADVIELVCPKCGAENEDKNFFCFSCGNKLRRKPTSEAKLKEPPKISFEPGSIKMVGEKVVAKVVICPRCNTGNREVDKFCHNCGKKLKPEHAKAKKGA
jgi:DNA-directed RNA polymerase subunit M/transcription elongation factor TFIIS